MDPAADRPTPGDLLLVGLLAAVAFGFSLVGGKPLSVHEARVPQLAREMAQEGRWLLPHSGGRPWLERPPLPHAATRVSYLVTGRDDAVWAARLPNAVAGVAVVLIAVYAGGVVAGRVGGIAAGVVLATCFEFYTYASQAEDDVYLALLVGASLTAFLKAESRGPPVGVERRVMGDRPASVWACFAFAGLTSLAKGPGPGLMQIGVGTVAALAIVYRNSWRRWLWPPGVLVAAALFIAWPAYAYRHYPSVWGNWIYDLTGPFGHEPAWYYLEHLPAALIPWTPLALLGVWAAWRRPRWRGALCLAVAPVILMSVSSRKHHHYLVPLLLPWAVVTATAIARWGPGWYAGLRDRVRRDPPGRFKVVTAIELVVATGLVVAAVLCLREPKLAAGLVTGAGVVAAVAAAGLGLRAGRPGVAAAAPVVALVVAASALQWAGYRDGRRRAQADFAREVARVVPADEPLLMVPGGSLDVFQFMFYANRPVRVLQVPAYLLDATITAPTLWVVARGEDAAFLDGRVGPTREAAVRGGESGRAWVLFEVTNDRTRPRHPPPPVPDVMGAMGRRELPPYP